ncbi:hypothetical protein SSX86_026714 [Deinandra increscens subsp. villosa]|uniref:Reverse transcriptase zinc-binding domain-containing protein n=1 Tax=Deinandra increscens subsp. villosa TaxID=3103831 RepID=A0AAP0CLX1_9ASTR
MGVLILINIIFSAITLIANLLSRLLFTVTAFLLVIAIQGLKVPGEALQSAMEQIGGLIRSCVEYLLEIILEVISEIVGFVFDLVKETVFGSVAATGAAVGGLVEKTRSGFDGLTEEIPAVVEGAVEMVTTMLTNLIKSLSLPLNGPRVSHLLFADDVMFLGDWSPMYLKNIIRLLRCFYLASGLKINLAKSCLYGIGIPAAQVGLMAESLGCPSGSFPINYLGLPIGGNMNIAKNWKPTHDKFNGRLSRWKGKNLSIGGRLTLIKSVLSALPSYFFSMFRAPKNVLEGLERIRKQFLWGVSSESKRIHWVKWDKIKNETSRLWRRVIDFIHSNASSVWNGIPVKLSIAGPWKAISKIDQTLSNASCSISDFGDNFQSSSIRSKIVNKEAEEINGIFLWCNWVPLKINIHIWRASLGRIPTLTALHKRGIHISDLACRVCFEDIETIDHVFCSCPVACLLWDQIGMWTKLPPIFSFSFKDILEFHSSVHGSKKKKKLFQAIFAVACWVLWKARNDKIHNGKSSAVEILMGEVKALSYLWISNRAKMSSVTWDNWCSFNFIM